MYKPIEVNPKSVVKIIQATFPDYRRKKVRIYPANSVVFNGVNWSGGSKSVYKACAIDGNKMPNQPDMGVSAPWNNPFEGLECNIPQGFVIVEGGWFLGKVSILTIYVNPEDMPKLIEYSPTNNQ